jgi:hypothetical protein
MNPIFCFSLRGRKTKSIYLSALGVWCALFLVIPEVEEKNYPKNLVNPACPMESSLPIPSGSNKKFI